MALLFYRWMIHDMTPLAEHKGLSINVQITDNLLVQGDKNRLRQVLSSLIGNAIKYTSRGEVTIRALSNEADVIMVQVQDTGDGMDREKLANIFDPYRRKPTGGQKYGGLGIGLALSRIYVELHKGRIWVESTPGVGTTISFSIPLYKEKKICPIETLIDRLPEK